MHLSWRYKKKGQGSMKDVKRQTKMRSLLWKLSPLQWCYHTVSLQNCIKSYVGPLFAHLNVLFLPSIIPCERPL